MTKVKLQHKTKTDKKDLHGQVTPTRYKSTCRFEFEFILMPKHLILEYVFTFFYII